MNKKSQLSIFILIGIVIFLSLLFVFMFMKNINRSKTNNQEKEQILFQNEINLFNSYSKSCLESAIYDGIYVIGKTGGYIKGEFKDEFNEFIISDDIPIYYQNNQNHMPSLEKVEKELSKYINTFFIGCMKASSHNFTFINEKEFNKNFVLIESTINEKKITSTAKYPFKLSFNDQQYKVSEVSQTFEFDFKTKYDIILEHITDLVETNNNPTISIQELSDIYNFNIIIGHRENNIKLYTIIFPELIYEDYEYVFAIKE